MWHFDWTHTLSNENYELAHMKQYTVRNNSAGVATDHRILCILEWHTYHSTENITVRTELLSTSSVTSPYHSLTNVTTLPHATVFSQHSLSMSARFMSSRRYVLSSSKSACVIVCRSMWNLLSRLNHIYNKLSLVIKVGTIQFSITFICS